MAMSIDAATALLLLGGDKAGNWERYVEALGGRLDLVADFGDRTVRLPVSATAHAA
jgi:hypothetical protein